MHLKKKWKSLISCPDIYQYICTWKSKYPSLLLKLINIVSVIIVEKPQKLSHAHFNYTTQFVSFSTQCNQYPTVCRVSICLTAAFCF